MCNALCILECFMLPLISEKLAFLLELQSIGLPLRENLKKSLSVVILLDLTR